MSKTLDEKAKLHAPTNIRPPDRPSSRRRRANEVLLPRSCLPGDGASLIGVGHPPDDSHSCIAGADHSSGSNGQDSPDAHTDRAVAVDSLCANGQASYDRQAASASGTHSSISGDQSCSATHSCIVSADLIQEIRAQHRKRVDFHRAEKRLTLQCKAICRRLCAGDKDEADKLFSCIEKGKGEHPQLLHAAGYLMGMLAARAMLAKERKIPEKAMAKLAMELPVWPFVDAICGFGAMGLAQIVGECGDLGAYANPAKVWKRMGLAVFNGKSQRRVAGAEAIEQGYSPERRAIMFCIGDSLLKKQNCYRELYLERKVYEAGKLAEREDVPVKLLAHRRAQRYAEKRLLRDLWRAWRGQAVSP